ncbi:MAG: FtsW/RodA/SpoVE family cell cycle protein [Dysgonamonadaceae bacterium]|jgi:cell division protein FtsW|nr:FtsW/RodA/SpoVE family cell cycle protein [Dysgonamonadaceae bacterium]
MEAIGKIFRGDRIIWMIFLFLCIISIVEVYSASSTLTYKTDYYKPIVKHTLFLFLGTVIVLILHSLQPKFFAVLILGIPVVWLLLVITKVLGSTVNEATRTFAIAGFNIQPSEYAKLFLIGATAFFLERYKVTQKDVFYRLIIGIAVITCALIMIDNFSTAFILFAVVIIMMFIGQIPVRKLLLFAGACTVAGGLFAASLFAVPEASFEKAGLKRAVVWKKRLINFVENDDAKDSKENTLVLTKDNYQVTMGKIAVARGGIIGVFPGNGQQRDFLPQAYSDFIYAIILEETGLAGGLFVLILYIVLFIRAGIIAQRCSRVFPKLLVMGSAIMIVTQALVNMAVAVDLIPVTGQPLPLVSRGINSTLITCAFIGIILSVSRFENEKGIAVESQIEKDFDAAAAR